MRSLLLAGLVAFAVLPAAAFGTPSTAASTSAPLDLETIMASPDWIGHAVESPYWSVDGRSLYYALKRDGDRLTSDARRRTVIGSSSRRCM